MKKMIAGMILACTTVVGNMANTQGDADGDGILSTFDITLMRRHILGIVQLSSEAALRADFNGDGSVTVLDIILSRRRILGMEQNLVKKEVTVSVREISYEITTIAGSTQSYGLELLWTNETTEDIGVISIDALSLKTSGNLLGRSLSNVRLYDSDTTSLNTGINAVNPTESGAQTMVFDRQFIIPAKTKEKSTVLRQDVSASAVGYLTWSIKYNQIEAVNIRTGESVWVRVIPSYGPPIHVWSSGLAVILPSPESPSVITRGTIGQFAVASLVNGMEPFNGEFIEFSIESNTDISYVHHEMALSVGDKILTGVFIPLNNVEEHIGTIAFELTEIKIEPFQREKIVLLGMVRGDTPAGLKLQVNRERTIAIGGISGRPLNVGGINPLNIMTVQK